MRQYITPGHKFRCMCSLSGQTTVDRGELNMYVSGCIIKGQDVSIILEKHLEEMLSKPGLPLFNRLEHIAVSSPLVVEKYRLRQTIVYMYFV